MHWDFQVWGINKYLLTYLSLDSWCKFSLNLAGDWWIAKLCILVHIGISVNHFVFWQFCDISGFSPLQMMILLGNKQNSLILLGLFSFSRMEIPVYNLGECTPWDYLSWTQRLESAPLIIYNRFQLHLKKYRTFQWPDSCRSQHNSDGWQIYVFVSRGQSPSTLFQSRFEDQ